MLRVLTAVLGLVFFSVAAANNDDGFIWIDANTKIRTKPVGSAGAGASAPQKAPKTEEKKEEKSKK